LQLRPLLSWEDCEKVFIESIPHPRQLAGYAVAAGEEYVALLESTGGFQDRSRFSIVGIGTREAVEANGMETIYGDIAGFLEGSQCQSLPCRDAAFLVVSYEAVGGVEHRLAGMLGRHEWPLATAFRPERLVVYDHVSRRAVVCPRGSPRPAVSGPRGALREFRLSGLGYGTPKEYYLDWVVKIREAIEEGEVFQVVVSRVEQHYYTGNLFSAYGRLAEINPSPYTFYLRLGEREILGASPELLVKLDKERLGTHPIAGTRPRGEGRADVELEDELLSDEKELAEHVMLVDLARNDIGAVAVPGTVNVTSYMDVEKYSHVQHIVSRVEALARDGLTFTDALEATLPAGTVSGAPKPRAMEYIAELEDRPRGPYAGAVGIAGSRAGEAAIVIRSAWSLEGSQVEIRAGAGIVYDSVPEQEYVETEYKLRALRRALGGE